MSIVTPEDTAESFMHSWMKGHHRIVAQSLHRLPASHTVAFIAMGLKYENLKVSDLEKLTRLLSCFEKKTLDFLSVSD